MVVSVSSFHHPPVLDLIVRLAPVSQARGANYRIPYEMPDDLDLGMDLASDFSAGLPDRRVRPMVRRVKYASGSRWRRWPPTMAAERTR